MGYSRKPKHSDMHPTTRCAVTAILLLATVHAHAQIKKNPHPVSIGINAGTFIYQGDLSPSPIGSWKTPGPVIGIMANRQVRPGKLLRLDISAGLLQGNEAKYHRDSWRAERALAFRAPVAELVFSGQWHPMGTGQKLSPYLLAGGGIAVLRITRSFFGFNPAYFANEPEVISGLAKDIVRPAPRVLLIVPVGGGLQYRLNEKFSLTAESTYRLTRTDYLDGFSQAANPGKGDHYFKHVIGLVYHFGRDNGERYGCPATE
jgi:hypothetical protein